MRVYWAVVLSILVHLLLYSGLRIVPPMQIWQKPQPIEISVIEKQPQKPPPQMEQIVRELEQLKQKLEAEDNALLPFKSAQRNRVKEQSRAAQIGLTKNRSLKSLLKVAQKPKASIAKQSPTPTDDGDIELKKIKKQTRDEQLTGELEKALAKDRLKADLEQGLSSVGEELPDDIKIGNFTSLNTDRYLYYSFYARAEELLRFRWETMIEDSINHLNPRNYSGRNRVWTTYMEVLLKPNGEFVKALIMKESGIKSFDSSAVQAFAEARFFPNPPQEMVKPDGFIHLKYGFNVHYSPRPFVQR